MKMDKVSQKSIISKGKDKYNEYYVYPERYT